MPEGVRRRFVASEGERNTGVRAVALVGGRPSWGYVIERFVPDWAHCGSARRSGHHRNQSWKEWSGDLCLAKREGGGAVWYRVRPWPRGQSCTLLRGRSGASRACATRTVTMFEETSYWPHVNRQDVSQGVREKACGSSCTHNAGVRHPPPSRAGAALRARSGTLAEQQVPCPSRPSARSPPCRVDCLCLRSARTKLAV